jgi:TonB family protein
MCKEGFFALNRIVLITIVIFSFIIPLLYLPSTVKPIIHEQIIAQVLIHNSEEHPVTTIGEMDETSASISSPVSFQKENPLPYSSGHIIFLLYLAGIFFSFLVFMHGILSVLFLLRKAKGIRKDGYYVFILEKDIPAFSFCKMILISKADYTEHGKTILTHEMQHIQLGHFYDLLLMEIVKMIHWFNPVTYWLIQDLKAIHEFQADRHTLTSGIDVNKYQLLIIEKGVGSQRFALANCFNHCQIKKRITMMNKQMTSKAGIWKVATFLPLLALLLMAFGRTGENVQKDNPSGKEMLNQVKATVNESTSQSKDSIYSITEVMPQFPGGDIALNKWLRKNMKYPKEATAKNIQGKVFVSFIINKEGKILNPKVTKRVDPLLDAEALRVVKIMPNWIPAKDKGKTVSVSYALPLNFVLE